MDCLSWIVSYGWSPMCFYQHILLDLTAVFVSRISLVLSRHEKVSFFCFVCLQILEVHCTKLVEEIIYCSWTSFAQRHLLVGRTSEMKS